MKKKKFFVDFDGTLCFKESPQTGTKLVPFEIDSVKRRKMVNGKTGIDCFGHSFISPSSIVKLKNLRNLGVEVIGVTARHEDCIKMISRQVLEVFDYIYYYCEARRLTIVDGKPVQDHKYNKEWLKQQPKANFTEAFTRLRAMRSLYPKVEVLGTNDFNAPAVYLNVENLGKNEVKEIIELFEDYPYCLYYKQSSIIELRFIHLSKGQAISRHINSPTELTICAGDGLDDLDMLSICDLGIYPKSLIEDTTLSHNFITSGLLANKVVSVRNKNWKNSMLDEAINYFSK